MSELRRILRELGYTEAAKFLPDLAPADVRYAIAAWRAWAVQNGRMV